MNKIVLLPSAKLVPVELQNEFGPISSAMIPLDSRPALHYISDYYQKLGFNFLIAAHEGSEEINRYCRNHSEINAQVVDVGNTNNLGQTMLNALESLIELPKYLIINFADTYVEDKLNDGNFICYVEQEDVYRWTTFQLGDDKNIAKIKEKCTEKNGGDELQYVFVGVFGFNDVNLFLSKLRDALREPDDSILDPYYKAVRGYFNCIHPSEKTFQEVKKWWDFGHLDTYYDTKKEISLNCRHFNFVRVDDRRSIIHKTSNETKTLIDEIGWYLKLPINLQYMVPRIFDYSLSFDEPYIDMEFYGYPALNDMYLFGKFDIGTWNQFFDAIEYIITDMASYRLEPNKKNTLLTAMQTMYEKKTRTRLEGILSDDRFDVFFSDEIIINNKKLFGLNKVLKLLPEVIDHVNLYNISYFTIIHGDLCLSNILYDRRNRIVRLIDPRGGFGEFNIYGDPRYDIAKLCHSIEGDYDFLVNGLFSLKWKKDGIDLKVHLQKRHMKIKSLFRRRLMKKWEKDYAQIKLIESLLFLSMIPLHADRFKSQIAFLTRGLEIFTAVASNTLPVEMEN